MTKSRDRGGVVADVCASLILAASVGLAIADSTGREITSVGYLFADNAFALAALSGLLLVLFAPREGSKEDPDGSRGAIVLGVVAAIAPLVAATAHYGAIRPYPALTATAVGLSSSSLAFVLARPSMKRDSVNLRIRPTVVLPVVMIVTLAFNRWLPGSVALRWILTPVAVLLAPGLTVGAVLLPRSTGWAERLLWAPPISVSMQVLGYMWIDALGVSVNRTEILALTAGCTLLALPFVARVERFKSSSSPESRLRQSIPQALRTKQPRQHIGRTSNISGWTNW